MVVIEVDLKSSSTICDTGNLLSVTFKPALSPSLLVMSYGNEVAASQLEDQK